MASIQRRERQGTVRYRVQYRDPAGNQRGKVFDTLRDARRFQAEVETSKATGSYVDRAGGKVLFAAQAERWFATKAAHKPATRRAYRQQLAYAGVILDAAGKLDLDASAEHKGLGMVPLAKVDTMMVREWLAGLTTPREDGSVLSASRRRNALQVVSQVLGSAVEGGKLVTNKAAGVKPPKSQPSEMLFLTAAEVETLADAIDPRYRTLIIFASYTALRAGEVAALRVKDLDMLRGTVRVHESATEVSGKLEWGDLKSYEARTVHLPASVRDELAAYLAGRPHDRDDLVFTAPEGGPLRQSRLMAKTFRPAVCAAGLPAGLRFHDLRHTAISLAIRSGASIKAIQKMAGHATAAMTLDRYGHLFPDELESVASRLDGVRAAARVDGSPAVAPAVRTVASSQVMTLPTVRNAG